MALLEVKNLGISFGGLKAVENLNMKIEKGALVGLIGPNGAGKTTAFNLLTGVYLPTSGSILLEGKNIVGKKPAEICQAGIARTFQNIRLFRQNDGDRQRKSGAPQPFQIRPGFQPDPYAGVFQKGAGDPGEGGGNLKDF